MEGKQLSLFPNLENQNDKNYHKKAKLGRYEKIQYELNNNDGDPYKKLIKIEEKPLWKSDYKFIDLFCGAGGMTQGLAQAGFQPISSVEENSIASATHRKNFPTSHHFCGDIKEFNSTEWLNKIGKRWSIKISCRGRCLCSITSTYE